MSHRNASIFFIMFFLITVTAQAASPVWKISKAGQQLYLGGTIHLLAPNDHPLPSAFSTAYEKSAHIVLETDINAANSAEFQQKMLAAMTYADGRTLDQVLKPATMSALTTYFEGNHLPVANFMAFTPSGIALVLPMLEFQKLGMRPESGVDSVFAQKAVHDGKPLGQLETLDQQLAMLSSLALGREDDTVMYTLAEISKTEAMVKEMKRAWRSGDNATFEKNFIVEIKRDFPTIYRSLLKDRNDAWLIQLQQMLSDAPIEFVLVGALHLAGEDGLLQQLKMRGYSIENLQ